ncbi:hypothetical protein [Sulfitobacter sp. AS92]|uniref:hypothetical protein n=1 Tax=Sulfitobacter sp. AS92 TaxID=3135783 RepID=UPI00319DA196
MENLLNFALVAFSASGLFAGSGALFACGLRMWINAKDRYRLIMDAYAAGFEDGAQLFPRVAERKGRQ